MPEDGRPSLSIAPGRLLIYGVLLFFVLYFLAPLVVMLMTSVKTA